MLGETDKQLGQVGGPPAAFWPLLLLVIGVIVVHRNYDKWFGSEPASAQATITEGSTFYAGITDASETGVLTFETEVYEGEGEDPLMILEITLERASNGETLYMPIEAEAFADMIDELLDEPLLVVGAPGVLDSGGGNAGAFVAEFEKADVDIVDADQIDLLAQALAVVGDTLPGNQGTTDALRAWMTSDAADEVGGVLWIGARDSDSPQTNSWQFVFPQYDAVQFLELMLIESEPFDPDAAFGWSWGSRGTHDVGGIRSGNVGDFGGMRSGNTGDVGGIRSLD